MTICAVREITPHLGKEALAESRVRRAAGVMARHGAYTRIFKVIAGADVGDYSFKVFIPHFLMEPLHFKNLAVIQSFRLSSTSELQTQQAKLGDRMFIVWSTADQPNHLVH